MIHLSYTPLTYTEKVIEVNITTGCRRVFETHFQFLITLKLSTGKKVLHTSFYFFVYPHLCEITAQLLVYILRYCVKTEGTLFSFSPRMGFSHIYIITLLIICCFGMTNTSLFS